MLTITRPETKLPPLSERPHRKTDPADGKITHFLGAIRMSMTQPTKEN